jgi:hypothetical protein
MISAGITVNIDALIADMAALQTQVDSIPTETSASIIMTDSDSNGSATLAKLYDGNKASDGVEYTLAGTDKYIQYEFGVEDYVDRVALWTDDADGHIYIGYSTDGTTWAYLKAEDDHTLDATGKLVSATTLGDAQTNYLQLAAGANLAIFPNNVVARYCRLFLTGTYTTEIYELIFSRILIAEMGAIANLSVLSATFGSALTFAGLDSSAATKLTAIADGATRNEYTGDWADTTVYIVGDIVLDADYGWICILAHTSEDGTNNPPSYPTEANTWWSIYTVKGADGASSAGAVLTSNLPTVFTATDGTLDGAQSDIVFTATTSGITTPTYVWSQSGCQSAPTASTTSTYTVTAANFGTSKSAIITCAVQEGGAGTTYTNKTTIVRLELSTAAAGADVTQTVLSAGADIQAAVVGAATLISGGYIRTTLLDVAAISAGSITMTDAAGYVKTTGKDAYDDTTAGFFVGYDSGLSAYAFTVGDATNFLQWNGSALSIRGDLILGSTNDLHTAGKGSYTDNTAGFWLGYDSTAYKLFIGSSTEYIKWSGSALLVGGDIIATGNIVSEAATIPRSGFTAGAVSAANGTNYVTSSTWTSVGRPCQINMSLEYGTGFNGTTSLVLQRGTTTIATYNKVGYTTYGGVWSATFRDTPSAGSVSYRLRGTSGGTTFTNRSITITENKR